MNTLIDPDVIKIIGWKFTSHMIELKISSSIF